MTSEQPAKGLGLAGAAQALETLLDKNLTIPETPMVPTREDKPGPKASKEAEAKPKEDEAPQETPAEEPVAEEAAAPEGEAAEPQAEQPEEKPADATQAAEPFYTVKIDGKEEKVSLSELRDGYSRTGDYTRKTQALALDRKSVEEEREKIKLERAQYAQLLPALQTQLQQATPQEPNWQRLYAENPEEFVRQKALWDLHRERLQAVATERARIESEQTRDTLRTREQKAEDGRKVLFEEFPEWKSNNDKWEKDRTTLVDRLYKRHNLNDQEVSVITLYPTILSDMHKARLYDDMMANKPKPVERKAPAAAAPGSSASAPKPQTEITRAKQRLAKTGKLQDAAAIFENLID